MLPFEKQKYLSKTFTHDLFLSFAKNFHIFLKYVVICKIVNGIYYYSLFFENNGFETKIKEHKLNSKTSDAIALSVRSKLIYIQQHIYLTKQECILKIDDLLIRKKIIV
ncbi:bifunctional nuclease family protein [Blattabacterium cuenoti]|uniref:bifunctional nuclease family protein n=1 Tax=Blattabacterium cuenoti TaxID=1653831 RepID=UPI001EEAA2DF|nr:bifunctional nuclease domain-containing protein [Blattabacterium cuenoti]